MFLTKMAEDMLVETESVNQTVVSSSEELQVSSVNEIKSISDVSSSADVPKNLSDMEVTEVSSASNIPVLSIIDEPPNRIEESINADSTLPVTGNISKKQLKRLKKKANWELVKREKRKKWKQSHKLKMVEAKKRMEVLPPSRKALKAVKMKESPCKTGVVIDLSFDKLMSDRELGKLSKQLLRCYSINRRSQTPVQYYITGLNGAFKDVLSKQDGYVNWDVNITEKSYLDMFPTDKIVYLSSDSDNVLEKLESDKFYIIGGLVDHNAHKGLCHKLAEENKIAHAQLPIKQHIEIKQRTVLTIDQVFQILLKICEGKTWPEALLTTIPERKGATLKPVESSISVDHV